MELLQKWFNEHGYNEFVWDRDKIDYNLFVDLLRSKYIRFYIKVEDADNYYLCVTPEGKENLDA